MFRRSALAMSKLATVGVAVLAGIMVPQPATAAAPTAASTSAHPNVMLIILDDIGIDTASNMYPGLIDKLVRQYGPSGLNNPGYRNIRGRPASTPVLDRFAAQSVTFSQAWAQPFCSPTRASMLTGLYASHTGLRDYTDHLASTSHSVAQDLKAAGYSTAIFGKWHMAGLNVYPGMKPKQAGFDLFRGNLNGAIDDYWDYDYQVQDASTPADTWRHEKAPQHALPGVAPTTYAAVTQAADTIDWISEQHQAGKPWFAWLGFNLSHITPGDKHAATIVPNADTLDKASLAEMKACGGEFGTSNIGSCSGEALNRAMTNSMDTMIGKLIDTIDRIDPNTYVIILGDNGTPMYGRPGINFIDNMYITRDGRAKGTGYESGTRVPLAIRGPGIKPGTSDAVVHVVDMFSTILELARVRVPQQVSNPKGAGTLPLDGRSLAPIVMRHKDRVRDPVHDYVVSETAIPIVKNGVPGPAAESQVAVRNTTYKVLCIRKSKNEQCSFYNLIKDPLEEYPLTAPATCPSKIQVSFTKSDEPANYCFLRQAVRTQTGT